MKAETVSLQESFIRRADDDDDDEVLELDAWQDGWKEGVSGRCQALEPLRLDARRAYEL